MLSKNFSFSLAYVSDYPDYSFTFHRIQSYSISTNTEFGACWNFYFSERMQTRRSFSNYKSHPKLFKSNSRRLLSDLSPNLIPRNFDLCLTILFGSVFSNGILHTFVFDPDLKINIGDEFKCRDLSLSIKNPKARSILRRFIFKSCIVNYCRAKSNQTLGRVNRSIVRSSKL
jgi:hypothetical protein